MNTSFDLTMHRRAVKNRALCGWLLVIGLLLGTTLRVAAFGTIFLVNSTGDQPEATPDSDCETAVGNGVCTLRAAIQLVNTRNNGGDGIAIGVTGTITLNSALPNINVACNIGGPGPDKLTVQNPNPQQTPFRIFNVTASGTVSISGMTMSNGTVTNDNGGSIQNFNAGTVNVTRCVVRSGGGSYLAVDGGGIYNRGGGAINITNCNFFQVAASGNGGAICNGSTGTITVKSSTLDDCSASNGGGIFNNGTMTIVNTEITIAGAHNGGGIYNNGTTNLSNSLVSANDAHNGGGIYNADFATANVTNSTFYFNTTDLQNGGGIYNQGTLNVSNSTFDLNVAGNFTSQGTSGGGIYNDSQATGSTTVKSTIIARDAANCNDQFPSCANISDVAGSFISQGFNLIGSSDGSTGFTAATDITGTSSFPVDPGLDPNGVQPNGGPTETVALLSGSRAIDKGNSTTIGGIHLTVDQRGVGYVRKIDDPSIANASGGDGTDIGAFELGAGFPAVSSKTHGPNSDPTKTFGINLPLTLLQLGIECRRNTGADTTGPNVGHDHEVILTFPIAVTVGDASVTSNNSADSPTATAHASSNVVTVDLHNIPNARRLTITLTSVSDGTNTNDVSIPMGVLLGDVNTTAGVDGNDVSAVQSHTRQTLNGANFQYDVNVTGAIDGNDVSLTQSNTRTHLP
jgi:CSLREA domain-containing protein